MDVQHVAQFYQQLDKSQLHRLIEIYHPDVVFEDAAHRIEGFDALYQYFLNLYQNVHTCTLPFMSSMRSMRARFWSGPCIYVTQN